MITTVAREKGQITLPQEIREAAALEIGDQVEWKVQEGEIRGRKLVVQPDRKRVYGKLVKRGDGLMLEIPQGFKLVPGAAGCAAGNPQTRGRP